MSDVWALGGAYEAYVGRWSRLVAVEFLDWLAAPPAQRWIDVGCGTGELSRAVAARSRPCSVLGVDPSEGFVGWAASATSDECVRYVVGDARVLEPGAADIVVSGLVLNFVPDLSEALAFMSAAAVGGTVAAYVWDYSGRMDLMRVFWDAAISIDSEALSLDEGYRFSVCRPDALARVWSDAGLSDVITTAIDVPTVFDDFDDFWNPFLGGQGPAPSYLASPRPERRHELRDAVQEALTFEDDGSLSLLARAWAVRGRSDAG